MPAPKVTLKLTQDEYRLLLAVCHPDRPERDPAQLNRAFAALRVAAERGDGEAQSQPEPGTGYQGWSAQPEQPPQQSAPEPPAAPEPREQQPEAREDWWNHRFKPVFGLSDELSLVVVGVVVAVGVGGVLSLLAAINASPASIFTGLIGFAVLAYAVRGAWQFVAGFLSGLGVRPPSPGQSRLFWAGAFGALVLGLWVVIALLVRDWVK